MMTCQKLVFHKNQKGLDFFLYFNQIGQQLIGLVVTYPDWYLTIQVSSQLIGSVVD